MRRGIFRLSLLCGLTMGGLTVSAQVPSLLYVQGRLLDNAGNPLSTNVAVQVAVFDGETGGTVLWTESVGQVPVQNGMYSFAFGTNAPGLAAMLTNAGCWLELTIDRIPMIPRQRLMAVPYALLAGGVTNGAINSAMLADGAVTGTKMAAGSVDSNHLAAGSVTSASLVDGAVTSDKLAPGAVGPDQLVKAYQSGSIRLAIPPNGVDTTVSAVFSPAFDTVPAVTVNLSFDGRIPGDLSVTRPPMPAKSAAGFSTHVAVAPYTDYAWGSPVSLDSSATSSLAASLAVVNGNPAIGYYDGVEKSLRYVRANDVDGRAWGAPISVDTNGDTGRYASMKVVNGNPAIAYFNYTGYDLMYVRATDADGATWGAPVSVYTNGSTGVYPFMAVVNGNPAIAFFDQSSSRLKYVRAGDADGTTWGAPVSADASVVFAYYLSLDVVNGNPAISYLNLFGTGLKYVRASDADGTTWNVPVTADPTPNVGLWSSLAVVDGNPAISYGEGTGQFRLKYVRASDSNGAAWGAPVIVDSNAVTALNTSLAVVNGNPAIGYHDNTQAKYRIRYVRANDATGGVWGAPVMVDTNGTAGSDTSMAIVNGYPAIGYFGGAVAELRYVTVTSAMASVDWVAVKP
ncbi:MAG: sialidase family protein [bacterium]